MHRVEGLEKAFCQLFDMLEKLTSSREHLDCLIQDIMGNCRSETKNLTQKMTILQLIDQYMTLSQKATSSDRKGNHKISRFSPIANRLKKDGKNSTLKKRLREACKEKPRSNNNVIDQWMYLDCELDEEGRADDNYEDLDNFLLPG